MNPAEHEQTIFAEALRLPPKERAFYLSQATADDLKLRREVESPKIITLGMDTR